MIDEKNILAIANIDNVSKSDNNQGIISDRAKAVYNLLLEDTSSNKIDYLLVKDYNTLKQGLVNESYPAIKDYLLCKETILPMRIVCLGKVNLGRSTLISSIFYNRIFDIWKPNLEKPYDFWENHKKNFVSKDINLKEKVQSPFFTNILNSIYKKDADISSYITELDTAYIKNEKFEKNESKTLQGYIKNPFFGRSFNNLAKIIKEKEINVSYLKLIQNIFEDKSKIGKSSSLTPCTYKEYVQKIYYTWLDKVINWMSTLLPKTVKLRPSSSWELTWAIVPIIWLSNFLDNCNLNIRAV